MTAPPSPLSPERTSQSASSASENLSTATGGFSLQRLSHAFARLMGATSHGAESAVGPVDSVFAPDGGEGVDDDSDSRGVTAQKIVEGLLFVGGGDQGPLTSRTLASVMRDVEPEEVEKLIARLNEVYRETGAPYEIVRDGVGFRMQLRESFRQLRHSSTRRARGARLSPAALETLAIVAYRQGITCSELDAQRSAKSHALLAQLVRRKLVRVERKEGSGKGARYFTTDRFQQLVGIRSLDELPRPSDLEDFQSPIEAPK